jgi:hypothetical protein
MFALYIKNTVNIYCALMAVERLAKYKKANEISLAEKPKVEYNKTNSSFILSMVSELKELFTFI